MKCLKIEMCTVCVRNVNTLMGEESERAGGGGYLKLLISLNVDQQIKVGLELELCVAGGYSNHKRSFRFISTSFLDFCLYFLLVVITTRSWLCFMLWKRFPLTHPADRE